MLHSPRFLRHSLTPKTEPAVLVKQLLALNDNNDSMVQLIKKQDSKTLKESLSLIADELLHVNVSLDDLFLLAAQTFPKLKAEVTRELLINSLNRNFVHQSIPCSDKYREAELMLEQMKRLTRILASLSMISSRLIHIGNNINEQLVKLGCQHTEETLFTNSSHECFFP